MLRLYLSLELHMAGVLAVDEHLVVDEEFVPLQLNAGLWVMSPDLRKSGSVSN